MRANEHATVHIRRSEDNLQESVLTMRVPWMELGSQAWWQVHFPY